MKIFYDDDADISIIHFAQINLSPVHLISQCFKFESEQLRRTRTTNSDRNIFMFDVDDRPYQSLGKTRVRSSFVSSIHVLISFIVTFIDTNSI